MSVCSDERNVSGKDFFWFSLSRRLVAKIFQTLHDYTLPGGLHFMAVLVTDMIGSREELERLNKVSFLTGM